MLFKIRASLIAYLLLSYLTAENVIAQKRFSAQDLEIIQIVGEHMKSNHIAYDHLEPLLYERFKTNLIKELDHRGLYLTAVDTAQIKSVFIQHGFGMNQNYFSKKLVNLLEIYKNKLVNTQTLISQMASLDFFEDDSINFSKRNFGDMYFPEDRSEQVLNWKRWLKLGVLYEHGGDSVLTGLTSAQINQILNTYVDNEIESEQCQIDNLLVDKNLSQFILNSCLKAYCKSFDPHSNYLTIEEQISFLNSLSSEYYGVGITYVKQGNQYFVGQISPFSPASNFADIREGDEIVGVLVNNKLINLPCLTEEEVDQFFYGDETNSLSLELRSSKDRKSRQFSLNKSWVNNNSNHTYAYLLDDSSSLVGYISFPAFYASMSMDGRSSAEDVALILMEFKKLDLDGIIFDLRYNGGGSVEEAQELTSYFVDFGPLITVLDKDYPAGQLIKDTKRGSLAPGKMIFLVNSLSASASELVCAAMLNYSNSLVVGAPTFGKATAQVMQPVQARYTDLPQGAVVVTNTRFYQINGKSYQGEGIVPDIHIASSYSKEWVSEEYLDYPLDNPDIDKKYMPIETRSEPIDILVDKVKQRNSLSFLDSLSQSLSNYMTSTSNISLNYESFRNAFAELEEYPFDSIESFKIIPMEKNEAFLKESNRLIEYKSKDPVLEETFRIMQDWVHLTNKP